MAETRPRTLGELRASGHQSRSVKDEMRANLVRKLRAGEELFPGVRGYEDSVVPQIVNAILAKHDFILLGLRGQAKSRILRQLALLLDEEIPILAGSEVNDDPLHPLSKFGRQMVEEMGDDAPVEWVSRDARYVEKLATPDVTIADMIGDVDPIKAARGGHILADELTIHFGLLPRANRGVFAINELPDLSGKIQVGRFNVLQEGLIKMSELMPDQVQPLQIPPPQSQVTDTGTIYSYPMPPVTGLDERIAPNAGLSENSLVLSLVPSATRRLLAENSLSTEDSLIKTDQPLAYAWQINKAEFIKMIRPWVQYGFDVAAEEGAVDEELESQVHTVLDVLSCFRNASGIAYYEDGVLVSHMREVMKDLEE